MSELFYTAYLGEAVPMQAEAATYPSTCLICLREHRLTVVALSAKKAVKHRRKKHAWLHELLVREGLAPS